jgi:hypothetical protein
VQGTYPTPVHKLWLAAESAKAAKGQTVREFGIGTDLNYNLLGWRDDDLVVLAQAATELMADPVARFEAMTQTAVLLRTAWGAEAFSFVCESYVRTGGDISPGSLAAAFASGNTSVHECVTVFHAEGDGEVLAVSVPYRYLPGRLVAYGEPITHQAASFQSQFPDVLRRALKYPTQEPPADRVTFYDTLIEGMYEDGVLVRWYAG